MTFTMHWPAPTGSAVRKRAYVPATAMSVSVTVNGGTPQYLDNPSTTLTIAADAGVDTFAFATYDKPDGQGNELSSASVTQTITLGVTNTVSAVLTGIIAKLGLSISNPNPNAGVPATVKISVTALDADGNTIIGANLGRRIYLSVSIPSSKEAGTLLLSTPELTDLSQSAELAYSGGTLTTATISASVIGFPTVSATFAPTPTYYQYPISGSSPNHIALGPDGNMWFTDGGLQAIGKITPAGVVTEFPTGIYTGGFSGQPYGIVAASDGNLWFTFYYQSLIGSITTSGVYKTYSTDNGQLAGNNWSINSITDRGDGTMWYSTGKGIVGYQQQPAFGSANGYFQPDVFSSGDIGIAGIATGPNEDLYATVYEYSNVIRITGSYTNPTFSSKSLTAGAGPIGIVRGPDGNMWFAEQDLGKIGVLSPSSFSVIAEYPTLTPDSAPNAITVGQDGALWFTELSVNRIGRITTGGVATDYAAPAGMLLGSVSDSIATAPDGSLWFPVSNSGVAKLVY